MMIKSHALDKKLILLLAVLLAVGAFLRFFRFEQFVMFLGDQGRDAIILKRIITLEHLPAVGPPSSIGEVYLGPFYYYFIAPWLLLFNFNPVGPAVGVGIFSCLYIIVNFLIVKELVNERVALFSSILTAFSATLINLSRFSWNPNLLPLFSLVTTYFFLKATKTNRLRFYLLTSIFLSFTIQLHYLSLLLIPPYILFFTYNRKNHLNLKNLLFGLTVFIVISFPLIYFDLRHSFINTNNLFNLLSQHNNFSQNKILSFFNIVQTLFSYLFNLKIPLLISSILFILSVISFFLLKKSREVILFFILIYLYLLGISFYKELKSAHYFGVIYPFCFIVMAYYLDQIKKVKIIFTIFFIMLFIYLNGRGYQFLFNQGYSQINKAQKVAKVIKNNNAQKDYTLISLPESSSDAQYRYFLEIWGHKPIDREILKKTNELFIACEHPCQTIGNPQWDIALFAPTKIDQTWKVEGVTIYKLSH